MDVSSFSNRFNDWKMFPDCCGIHACRVRRHLEVVPGATHLFEERGALEQVTGFAAEWFGDHLALQEGG